MKSSFGIISSFRTRARTREGAFWGGEAWLLHTHLVGNTNFVAYAWVHFQQAFVCVRMSVCLFMSLPCCCCCSFKFSFAVFLVFFYLFCLHFSCCCCCPSCLNELTDSSWNLLIDELDKQSLFLWAAFGLANELIKKTEIILRRRVNTLREE